MSLLTDDGFSLAYSFQEVCERLKVPCTCGASTIAAVRSLADIPYRHRAPCAVHALHAEWKARSEQLWEERIKHVPARAFALKRHEVEAAEEVVS